MSHPATLSTSTRAYAAMLPDVPRGFRLTSDKTRWHQAGEPTILSGKILAHLGVALGANTPSAVRADVQRERDYREAFDTAAELAAEMLAANEMDAADPVIWRFALESFLPFAWLISPPLVNPLQLGGLSCEWHEHGMNIEVRFRGVSDVFTIVEDALGEMPDFHGRDSTLGHALDALSLFAKRQV